MSSHPKSNEIEGRRFSIFLSACSGLLLTLSFPKAGIGWLAWIALVPLIYAVRHTSGRETFLYGLIAGIVHNLTLIYWLATTMHTYGQIPWSLCGLVLLGFSFYLALYPALFSWLLNRCCNTPGTLLWAVPVFWVGTEYFRSCLFTGFPWELLGYSQFRYLYLIQISDMFGVYGVSTLIALSNAVASMLLFRTTASNWKSQPVSNRLVIGSGAVFLAALAGTLAYGSHQLHSYREISDRAEKIRVCVVQGNISQSLKWNPDFAAATVDKYIALSLQEKPAKPDLVIWPETATPFYFLSEKILTERLLRGIRESETAFLLGSPAVFPGPGEVRYHNSAYLVGPYGDILGRYDKIHLVPFGEYVPLRQWLPFVGKMVQHVGDFHPGERGRTVTWQNAEIGSLICYELIFPDLAREMVQRGADMLVNLTNDAWYGRTSAPYQHFSMAVFRAVENRRALARAANTGISGFIDPTGEIIAATPLFTEAASTKAIPLLSSVTAYTRIGDVVPKGFVLAIFACLGILFFHRRNRK